MLARATLRVKILTLVALFAVMSCGLGVFAAVEMTAIADDAKSAQTQSSVGIALSGLREGAIGEIAANITGVATGAASASETLVQMGRSVEELARMSADLRERVAAFTY